ncbi:unnamed protein product [Penicillium olsonii]|nr:unnamed protein product [Penicillium olsonii]
MAGRAPKPCPMHGAPRPTHIDYDHRELYLQICHPETDGAVHWLIFMVCPGASRGTRLHSTGCQGQRRLSMELDKQFDSRSVKTSHYLGKIHVRDSIIVPKEAEKIPLQSCQLWACYLILRLELKGLLQAGLFDLYMYSYKHRMNENYGPGEGIQLPCRCVRRH